MTKPPAFQFYALDFLQGTKLMTLSETGAYIKLLCEQWDQGGVPDDIRALSRILHCSAKEADRMWNAIGHKFVKGDDDLYRNERLERERHKQLAYRSQQANRGRASGTVRRNAGSTSVEPSRNAGSAEPRTVVEQALLNSLSSSLSSSSSSSLTPPNGGVATPPPTLVRKRKPWNFYEGQRIEVPERWHSDHVKKLGLADAEAKLTAWYGELDAQLVRSQRPVGNWFKWLDACYEPWANDLAFSADLEAFRPKGA